jgi:YidC/Oxa1 family membrane protein insertase
LALKALHSGAALLVEANSGAAWALTTVAMVVLLRALLLPLAIRQQRSLRKLAALSPQLAQARAEHKGNPEKVAAATVEIYRTAGVNPLAGFVPLLVQVPVFAALYYVLNEVVMGDRPRYALDAELVSDARHADLWGAPLAAGLRTAAEQVAALGGTVGSTRAVVVALMLVMLAAAAGSGLVAMRQLAARGVPWWACAGLLTVSLLVTAAAATVMPVMLVLYLAASLIWSFGQTLWLRRRFPATAAAI